MCSLNNLLDCDFQVYKLSSSFFNIYNSNDYPEIEVKHNRPVNVLIVETHEDYLIGIPYRTRIRHNNALIFKNSRRSRKINNRSGLDYSKLLIIRDLTYLDKPTVIDNDEYRETVKNKIKIANDISKYIRDYISYINNDENKISSDRFNDLYKYSTIKYFHNELGI